MFTHLCCLVLFLLFPMVDGAQLPGLQSHLPASGTHVHAIVYNLILGEQLASLIWHMTRQQMCSTAG